MFFFFFPLPFPLDLKFYYHFRRQAFEEKIEYPSSLDKKGHLVRAVICEADSFPPPSLTTILTGGEDYGVLGGLLLEPLCFWGTPKRGYGDTGLGCGDTGVTCGVCAPTAGWGSPPQPAPDGAAAPAVGRDPGAELRGALRRCRGLAEPPAATPGPEPGLRQGQGPVLRAEPRGGRGARPLPRKWRRLGLRGRAALPPLPRLNLSVSFRAVWHV